MKRFYLLLAIAGAILPYLFFVQHFAQSGGAMADFLAAVFATPAGSGISVDLLFTSFVFWLFMFVQQSRGKGPAPWVFMGLNLLIGLSCALPAYLYAREHVEPTLAGVGTMPSGPEV